MIVEESSNQLLLDIWESVVLESRFRLTLKRIGEEQLQEFGEAHLPVIDSLRKGDGKAAGKQLHNLICKFHFLDEAGTDGNEV
jgi:DNA-binding GntR family transcriptional regulator